jgi:hypothetical protein
LNVKRYYRFVKRHFTFRQNFFARVARSLGREPSSVPAGLGGDAAAGAEQQARLEAIVREASARWPRAVGE